MDINLQLQPRFLAILLAISFALSCGEIATESNPAELEHPFVKDACEIYFCSQSDRVLNCTDQSLYNLPADIPSFVRLLDASNNKISVLGLHVETNYPNLNVLHLQRNNLQIIGDEFMLAFPNLTELDLSDNELENLPQNLQKYLQKLSLSGNKVSSIASYQLKRFHNLKELYLADNAISTLDVGCHEDNRCNILNKLEKLDLSGNKLEAIADYTFQGFPSLKALSLARNKIVSLDSTSFHRLKNLHFLDFSDNHITKIHNETLVHLSQLKYLYLKNNHLIEIPHGLPMLDWFDISYNKIRTVNETLKGYLYPIEFVNLGHNPFHCDCHMLWLKEWYDRREYILEYTDSIPPDEYIPTCATPSQLRGDSWDFIADDVFICEDVDKPNQISDSPPLDAASASDGFSDQSQTNDDESHLTFRPNLNFQLREAATSSLTVSWDVADRESQTKLLIKYYSTDQEDATTSFVQVQASNAHYILGNLEPSSVYILCLLPKKDTVSLSVEPNDCIKAATLPADQGKDDSLLAWLRLSWIVDSRIGMEKAVVVTCACLILSMVIVAGGLILAELTIRLVQPKEHKD